MSKQTVSLGTAPSGVGGDTPRSANIKINGNFDELYTALGATGNPAALPSALPLNLGGTASTSGNPRFNSVGTAALITGVGTQGLYMGWNESGTGEGNFVVNRGAGNGGFTWRSVNSNNTATGPAMKYSYDGDLTVPRYVTAIGLSGRQGISGGTVGQPHNFYWSGQVESWVGTTFIGNIQFQQSDYRIKKNIEDVVGVDFLDRIDKYRIVTYRMNDIAVWFDDGRSRQGLIAHEVQAVNELAAYGEKDAVMDDGGIKIQQLEVMALITDLIGAAKELHAQVKDLRAEIDELKAAAAPAAE
ncbi:tail fiber domain-containing protein [Pseudomonas chlororaphis]|uniref:tail fiber domain-containing protein n=1 Tax=Pseudomonas chlororaphis TaxID=587753 RepID=UPI002D79DCE8|nr:tail fiber domain-containing protein [Pseudomonas chlororaphis]